MTETTTTKAPAGFTGSEATKRLRGKVGKAQVSFLALSIMAKMKGKTNKAIRNDLGENCPSWISKIFTMADKVMAHIALPAQDEVSRMTVADAEKHVVAFIEGHMHALGVGKAFEKYNKVCHFPAECDASRAVLNPPAETPPTEAPKEEPAAEEAPGGGASAAAAEEVTTVDMIVRQAEGLDDAEWQALMQALTALAIKRQAAITDVAPAETEETGHAARMAFIDKANAAAERQAA